MKVRFIETYRIPADQSILHWHFNFLPFLCYAKLQGKITSIAFGWLWWDVMLYDFEEARP